MIYRSLTFILIWTALSLFVQEVLNLSPPWLMVSAVLIYEFANIVNEIINPVIEEKDLTKLT